MPAIFKQFEQRCDVGCASRQIRSDSRLAAYDLWPGRVEKVVREAVDTARQCDRTAGAIRCVRGHALIIAKRFASLTSPSGKGTGARNRHASRQQIETVIAPAVAGDRRGADQGRVVPGQRAGDEPSPGRSVRIPGNAFAEIGDQRPAAVAGYAEPGAATCKITSRQHTFFPPMGRCRVARMKLVAVRRDHQRQARMRVQRDYGKTHGRETSELFGR